MTFQLLNDYGDYPEESLWWEDEDDPVYADVETFEWE